MVQSCVSFVDVTAKGLMHGGVVVPAAAYVPLAGAACADKRNHLSGLDVEVNPSEPSRPVAVAGVREGHVSECYLPLPVTWVADVASW